ncbi:uncharacterized protein [Physcomitrium patens]|uniref:uncharacterized protein isoform X2 n=1 Tax=Physcomitrium patens TaxID=3218 RepID=UPI003CCCAFBA
MTCLLVDGTAMLRWDVQDLHQSRRQIRHQDRKCWQFACISATVNDVTGTMSAGKSWCLLH